MKKPLKITAITIALAILFTQCCKEDCSAKSYFYMSEPACKNHLKLYIDNQYKGELPFINTGATCENNYIKENALCIPVDPKNYKAEARDANGAVVASAYIKVRPHSVEVSSCSGQVGVASSQGVVIVDFSGDAKTPIQNAETK